MGKGCGMTKEETVILLNLLQEWELQEWARDYNESLAEWEYHD